MGNMADEKPEIVEGTYSWLEIGKLALRGFGGLALAALAKAEFAVQDLLDKIPGYEAELVAEANRRQDRKVREVPWET